METGSVRSPALFVSRTTTFRGITISLVALLGPLMGAVSCGGTAEAPVTAPSPEIPRAAASFGPVPSGMIVDLNTVHYEVTGTTVEKLRDALKAGAPRIDGKTWYGYAEWDVSWRYRYESQPSGCRMREVTVEFSSTLTLPEWDPPADADPGLVFQWTRYYEALKMHEEGHRIISAAAAREILNKLRLLRSMTCDDMSYLADQEGQRILDRCREENRAYDELTGHGRTQGASWPPRRTGGLSER